MNNDTQVLYQHCLDNADIFNDILTEWEQLGDFTAARIEKLVDDSPFVLVFVKDVNYVQLADALNQHLQEGGF